MTVIAWDGHMLAGDRRSVGGGNAKTTTKVHRVNDMLVGLAGDASAAEAVRWWLSKGADTTLHPWGDIDKDQCHALVIMPDRTIWVYENGPHPAQYHDPFIAIGCGRDYALAAMHLGRDAKQAVEVACAFDVFCGNGIDTLTHNAREAPTKSVGRATA